jgi:hypothetical protein
LKTKPSAASRVETPPVPTFSASWIQEIFNPKADGQCGFRALAHAFHNDEEAWKQVKKAMLTVYRTRQEFYDQYLGFESSYLLRVLQDMSSPCDRSNWLYTPDCVQLAADAYKTPIAILHAEGSLLHLPLGVFAVTVVPIGLSLAGEHFKYVKFNTEARSFSWPPVSPQHAPICKRFGFVDLSYVFTAK